MSTSDERVDERVDRAVADPGQALRLAPSSADVGGRSRPCRPQWRRAYDRHDEPGRPGGRPGTRAEKISHICAGRDLAALVVGVALDHAGELDLQPARQVEVVLGLHDVRHAALAGLRVDPDDRLVGAAHVLRVDRQVRHAPLELVDRHAGGGRVAAQRLEALLDRVLVRAGERGVDQVAGVRVALVHRQLVAVLDGPLDLVDVARSRSAGRCPGRTGSAPASPGRRCRCARRCRTGSPRPGRRRPAGPARRRPRAVPRSLCGCRLQHHATRGGAGCGASTRSSRRTRWAWPSRRSPAG